MQPVVWSHQHNTDDAERTQRLLNEALIAMELASSPAWPHFQAELDKREDYLNRALDDTLRAPLERREPLWDANELHGRIQELRRIRDQMVTGRVAGYKRWLETQQGAAVESDDETPEYEEHF